MNNEITSPLSLEQRVQQVVEAALLTAGRPLSIEQLCDLFLTINEEDEPQQARAERNAVRKPIRQALKQLQQDYQGRGVELLEVASGWRFQTVAAVAEQVRHLWALRPTRYSRAMLETLALVAYRQPITRSQIEEVRGVSVSTNIMRTLLEFGWVRVLGHKDAPGRPMLYGTTRAFLDHFGLTSLEQLPPLADLKELLNLPDDLREQLEHHSEFNQQEQATSLAAEEEAKAKAAAEAAAAEAAQQAETAAEQPALPQAPELINIPVEDSEGDTGPDIQWEAAEAALAELEAFGGDAEVDFDALLNGTAATPEEPNDDDDSEAKHEPPER